MAKDILIFPIDHLKYTRFDDLIFGKILNSSTCQTLCNTNARPRTIDTTFEISLQTMPSIVSTPIHAIGSPHRNLDSPPSPLLQPPVATLPSIFSSPQQPSP